jgi:hypothetical protein
MSAPLPRPKLVVCDRLHPDPSRAMNFVGSHAGSSPADEAVREGFTDPDFRAFTWLTALV